MRSPRGQATIEYVGALLLLAVALAGSAVAIGDPGIARAVVAKLRLGLCIVGMDVCTPEDAAARGLEPCLLSSERREETGGVSFLNFRVGATDVWTAERRSDGTILLRAAGGSQVDATAGFGFTFIRTKVGGSASAGLSFASGRTWRVTEAQLARIIERTHGDPSEITHLDLERTLGAPADDYREAGGSATAALGIDEDADLPSGSGTGRSTLGRRTSRDGTVTWYVDAGGAGAALVNELIPGVRVSGHAGAEYRQSDPPVLTLRYGGDHTETTLTLPLRTPEDRAAADRVIGFEPRDPLLPWRDLVNRIRARGTVQRNRYEDASDTDGWAAELALGEKLGLDHHITTSSRTLVAADILNGAFPARREDCLGGA